MNIAITIAAATVVILVMVRFALFRLSSSCRHVSSRRNTRRASRDSGWEPTFTPLDSDEAHVSMF